MIENLNGTHETVIYRENTSTHLYDNTQYEEYPPHWHTALEIIMVGKENYSVKCSQQTYELHEGDILLICPCVLHSLPAAHGQRYILQSELQSAVRLQELDHLFHEISPCFLVTLSDDTDLYNRVHALLTESIDYYIQNDFMWETSILSRLFELMILIGNHQRSHLQRLHTDNVKERAYFEKFTEICQYIDSHCADALSLEQTARIAGFSKYYFARLFKQFTGTSFYKYISQRRIFMAEQLLVNPRLSITDIALQCGFGSISSFIRMFKLLKGYTPSVYRDMRTVLASKEPSHQHSSLHPCN